MCVCVCVCVCVSLSLSLPLTLLACVSICKRDHSSPLQEQRRRDERERVCYADVTSDTNPIAKLRGREIIGHPAQLLDLDRGQRCHRTVDKVHALMPNSGKKELSDRMRGIDSLQ